MFRPDLTARTISSNTALPCLDHVCKIQGFETTRLGDRVSNSVVSIADLLVIATKRGLKLRPKSLSWRRLLSVTTAAPVLLRLNNGNMVVALKSQQSDPTEIVVSDPLYESGKPFILPSDALGQVWSGEAVIAHQQGMSFERAVNWAIGLLSCCGVLAGVFFLYKAFREVLGL